MRKEFGRVNLGDKKVVLSRVSKLKAKRLFQEGVTIYLYPCMANPSSIWLSPPGINAEYDSSFDTIVNHYEYYNCNNELGRYAKFFVEFREEN